MDLVAIVNGDTLEFTYTNYKGETSVRRCVVNGWLYGSNKWHTENQFLLNGFDLDKGQNRSYAINDMTNVKVFSVGA